MSRFNVQHPVTKEWRCFSTIVDDWITDWMDEKTYQHWREMEYGRQAGDLCKANMMSLDNAELQIERRKRFEEENSMSDYIKHKEYKLPNGGTVTAYFDELGRAMITIQALDALFDIINSSDVVEVVRCKDCVNYIGTRCLVANHHVAEFEDCMSVFRAKRKE